MSLPPVDNVDYCKKMLDIAKMVKSEPPSPPCRERNRPSIEIIEDLQKGPNRPVSLFPQRLPTRTANSMRFREYSQGGRRLWPH